MPQPSEWLHNFQTLHAEHQLNKEQREMLEFLKTYEKVKDSLGGTGGRDHESELRNAAKKLKSNKAVYSD